MNQEPTDSDRPVDATVVMPKSAVSPAEAATVINQAATGSVSFSTSGISVSQRTLAAASPPVEKSRSPLLALAGGAATGLLLFAITALWLSRGH